MSFCPPDANCKLCPRLVQFRNQNKEKFPHYHNGSVESFGSLKAQILVVGLAPGLNGANQTNRPFTSDYAGDVLYPCLKKFGFATGEYKKVKNDGFELKNVRISNAVRCVPPQNKVTTDEVRNCAKFLIEEINSMQNLKLILSLGSVSHSAVLKALGYRLSEFKFSHGAKHALYKHNILLFDSYHTSRYNINTGVLTYEMFDKIIKNIKGEIEND
jgi:uracil-DNA glycosylase family 4